MTDIVVFGPLELPAREGQHCDFCDRELEGGSPIMVGRVNGQHVHVCDETCFESMCEKARTAA